MCEDDTVSSLGVKEGGEYSSRGEKNRYNTVQGEDLAG